MKLDPRREYIEVHVRSVTPCTRDNVPAGLEIHATFEKRDLRLLLVETLAGSMFFGIEPSGLTRAPIPRSQQKILHEYCESELARPLSPLLRRSDPVLVAIRNKVGRLLNARSEAARPALVAEALAEPILFNTKFAAEFDLAK